METKLAGAYRIVPSRKEDDRGFFARTWCRQEFQRRGLCDDWVQASASFNRKKGTLRGLHYQIEPHPEIKLIQCTRGALYDVIVDLRPESPTFLQWHATELTAENGELLYVSHGFAHGFQTLTDDTEVHYQISDYYSPELCRGIRWNDPSLNIHWPECTARSMSAKDRNLPLLAHSDICNGAFHD